MASSRKPTRKRGKRPTATIDLKAKEVSTASKTDTQPDQAKAKTTPAASTAEHPNEAKKQASPSSAPKAGDAKTEKQPVSSATTSSTASAKKEPEKKSAPSSTSTTTGKSAQAASAKPKPAVGTDKPDTNDGGGMRSAITHLVAGGVGGLLAVFGMQQFGAHSQTTPDSSATAAATAAIETMQSRLSTVEKSVADNASAAQNTTIPAEVLERVSKLEGLNETLAGIAETQNKLQGQASDLSSKVAELSDPAGGGAAELRSRLDAMEGTIASLAKAAEGADNKAIPQLAALVGRLNDLRTEMEAKVIATRKAAQSDVETRFVTVETALKDFAKNRTTSNEAIETLTRGNTRVSRALETVRADTDRLTKDVTELKSSADQLDESVTETKNTVANLKKQIQKNEARDTQRLAAMPKMGDVKGLIAPVEKKLATVDKKVSAVLGREAMRADSARQIVLAIELANLRRAIDQGRSVEAEVKRIKASAPSSIDLAPLDKLVNASIPTREELAGDFRGVARKIIQSESKVEGGSAIDQLWANARSIIRVRKTGDIDGTTTDAILARAEDDLKRNDIRSATAELKNLTGIAAEAASDWMSKARDRLAIDATLEKIESGLKKSVSSATTN